MKLADYFTMGNFIAGMISIFFSIQGMFIQAAVFMMVAVLFDFLDGKIARMLKQTDEFGKELDSLADLTSFGIAPAVFGFAQGLDGVSAIVLVFFAASGMFRLARFNVTKVKGFEGVPITTNGIIFPLIFLIFGIFHRYILVVYLLMGILMISKIKIKKW